MLDSIDVDNRQEVPIIRNRKGVIMKVEVTISHKMGNIHSCAQPDSSQRKAIFSNFLVRVTDSCKLDNIYSCSKPAGRQRQIIMMMVTTSMTTLDWILAAATSTNRCHLFLKGEGHHW